MNYGLYLSSAGLLTNLHRQDVAANNLANVSTAGFKHDLVTFRQRDPEAIEDALGPAAAHGLLDRLGGGVMLHQSRVDASPGPLKRTGNNMDLGVEGEGFFVVRDPDNADDGPLLTRDGRLAIAPDGRLMAGAGQYPLLDVNDQPIVVDPEMTVQVDERGNVRQDGTVTARIQLIDAGDANHLDHRGEGLYEADAQTMIERPPADGRVQQGFVEQSNVDPIAEMLRLIESSRAISIHGTLIGYHDRIMDQAANTLGRVA